MTDEQKQLVRHGWQQLKPDAKEIGYSLYVKLFNATPFLRHMFNEDITDQACKLAAFISFVVSKLHRLGDILPDIKEIGAKHSSYHIAEHWYDVVGNCFVQTVKEGLINTWDEKQEQAWQALFTLLKTTMIEGAASGSNTGQ